MSCDTSENKLSIKEIEEKLDDAKKSLVDKKYVMYNNPGHLFDYKIDFEVFLEDISTILAADD